LYNRGTLIGIKNTVADTEVQGGTPNYFPSSFGAIRFLFINEGTIFFIQAELVDDVKRFPHLHERFHRHSPEGLGISLPSFPCHSLFLSLESVLSTSVSSDGFTASILLTTNRPLDDWGKLLGDNAASSAIQDCLLHRGHLLKFEGKSYRR